MRNASIENKLKILQDRKLTITAKMQKLEASAKTVVRKQDLQKKILVGAYYLEQAVKNNGMKELQTIMLEYLQRESDKKLFKDL
jgi:hypothetical protein